MAHEVRFSVREGSIMNRDVIFKVFQDKKRLGDLYVSKGGVDWRPKNKQYASQRLSWDEFVKKIERE